LDAALNYFPVRRSSFAIVAMAAAINLFIRQELIDNKLKRLEVEL